MLGMNKIIFVTGNQKKFEYAHRFLGDIVTHKKIDLPEIQSLDLQEVVKHKLNAAWEQLQQPVIVEDVSLEFESMGRLPGTFIRFFEEEIGLDGLCRLLDDKTRRCTAKAIIGYRNQHQTRFFYGEIPGTIAENPCGDNYFGFDSILIPDGYAQTRASLPTKEWEKTYLQIKPWNVVGEFIKEIK